MKSPLLLLVILIACTSLVHAQKESRLSVYGGAGTGIPISSDEFSDYWKLGFGSGGGVGYLVTPRLEVAGTMVYTTFPLDKDNVLKEAGVSGASIDGGKFRALAFGIDVKRKHNIGATAASSFFILGGLGMTKVKRSAANVSDDTISVAIATDEHSETKFSLSSGIGFDAMVSPKVGVWVKIRWITVFTSRERTSYLPITGGLKYAVGGN